MTIGNPPTEDMVPITRREFNDIYLSKATLDLINAIKNVPESCRSQVQCTVIMHGGKYPMYYNF